MYVYIYVCMHIYICMHAYIYVHIYLFLAEQGSQLHADDINDIITLAKDLKIVPPVGPIESGIETLTENI